MSRSYAPDLSPMTHVDDDWHPYYDRTGHPITPQQAHALYADVEARMVGHDVVVTKAEGPVFVSTMHVVSDMATPYERGPLIFETLVVFKEDRMVRRYSTEAQARAGHHQIVTGLIERDA